MIFCGQIFGIMFQNVFEKIIRKMSKFECKIIWVFNKIKQNDHYCEIKH